jgi:hypothetical protein
MAYDLEATDLLENCLDNGFEPPLYLIAIGANGSIIVARYTIEDDGLKLAVLTEHVERDGFHVPMNIRSIRVLMPINSHRQSSRASAMKLTFLSETELSVRN